MFISLRRMVQNAFIRQSMNTVANYEEAVKALHNLQSNANYLQSVIKQTYPVTSVQKLKIVEKYLLRSGITIEQLDDLNIIHVAGTKGKGSTCAFTEAILKNHGFNTGFFSSPHLVSVRERIRINGQPISQLHFAHYFWKVYKKLENAKEHETDMPPYFSFLTILMFNVFLEANIDVAIIEVGIGGESDSTNIIRNPVSVGITSLGLDHTSLLGNTLEEIAYEKSGIFKPGTTAYTVPQTPEAMRVLKKRAIEKNCQLYVAPPFEDYTWENLSPILGITANVQRQNASLAIQLASKWISSKTSGGVTRNADVRLTHYAEIPEHFSMDKVAIGLASCKWPGRTQILRCSVADFFLDGAHTLESIQSCISWFKYMTGKRNGPKILIFNTTGKRDSSEFLFSLKSLHFEKAYFVPNYAGIQTADDTANSAGSNKEKALCEKHFQLWGSGAVLGDSLFDVLESIKQGFLKNSKWNTQNKPQVLVTGSLHLVGAALAILDPNLTMTSKF